MRTGIPHVLALSIALTGSLFLLGQVQAEPSSSTSHDKLEGQCGSAGGSFTDKYGPDRGSYRCDFSNGTSKECNSKQQCVTYQGDAGDAGGNSKFNAAATLNSGMIDPSGGSDGGGHGAVGMTAATSGAATTNPGSGGGSGPKGGTGPIGTAGNHS